MTFYTISNIALEYQRNLQQEKIIIDEEVQAMSGTSADITVGDIYTV